jgi:uncharacterized repeat protein (TIGR01451 family)
VYDWDTSTNTLTLVTGGAGPGGSYVLAGVSFAYGIAFDEINDRLYIADQSSNTVRYFETTNFTESGNIVLSTHRPIGIAVDQVRNFLYTGAIFNGDVNLVKYDLNTDTETAVDINTAIGTSSEGAIGVAVDEDNGNVYVSTGFSYDGLLIFDSALNNLNALSRSDIVGFDTSWGDPTGLAIPRGDISFNPLSFSKSVDLSEAATGADLTYDLCYDNAANALSVNNVTITDNVPQGASFVSASDGGTNTSGTVTWNIGTLAAGAAQACVQMVVNVTAPADSIITNIATIDSDDTPPTTQSVVTNVIVLPELGFSKVARSSLIASGENLTYDLCYDNTENDFAANNAIITDTLPTGTSFVSATGGGSETSGVVSWDIGTLSAGDDTVCVELVVNVSAPAESTITNTATIDSDETGSSTATETTDVGAPIIIDVDYSFKGKGGGSATGPLELFLLMIGSGVLLMRRKKRAMAQQASTFGVAIVAIGLLVGTPAVHANSYVGISAGVSNANYTANDLVTALPSYTLNNVSVDDTDNGWKIYAGYEFTANIAVEVGYVDLGEVNSEFGATIAPANLQTLLADAAAIHPYMISGLTLAGVGSFDVTQTISVFGKIGVYDWDAEGNVKEIGSGQLAKIDESGTDFMLGLGIKFDLYSQFSVRAEWERYNNDRNDMNFYSVGIEYRF